METQSVMAKEKTVTRKRKTRIAGEASAEGLLKDQAYAEVKRRILEDEFQPGTFLSERQVSELLDVSKTPIRAAFQRLELEGFVSISPQQGVVVLDVSMDDIADHFELRVALECYVASSLAGNITPEQSARLAANLDEQRECVENDDLSRTVELDGKFHLLLSEFLGNKEIHRVMWQLRDKMYRVIQRVHTRHPERLASNYPEHRAIADAILAGDPEKAAEAMEAHLMNGRQILMNPRTRSHVAPYRTRSF